MASALDAVRLHVHYCGRAEHPDDRLGDLAGRRSDIDDQRILLGPRLLESTELTLQQARRHEMAAAPCEAIGNKRTAAAKVDQPYFQPIAAARVGLCDRPRIT
jgi:hypothetical protein